MKITKWLCILMLLAILFCAAGCDSENTQIADYNEIMSELDMADAKGILIAGYDVEAGEYITDHIPEELQAQEPNEVGYILKIDFEAEETSLTYLGGIVYGDRYHLQLVECSTGVVLAEKTFDPYYPDKVQRGYRASPLSSDLTEWISHVYPQWSEGEGPTHDYKDATCQKPKTCTVCGKTGGDLICHTLDNNKCTMCEKKFRNEMDIHNLEWTFDENDTTAPMEGACTRCGAAYSNEFDLSLLAGQLISGTWTLDHYFKDGEHQGHDTHATLEVGKDHTLVIHAPDGDHAFTWEYTRGSCSASVSANYDAYYLITDEDGNEFRLGYSHLGQYISLRFANDVYSLVFK